jgi:Ner family transcriptional regulator
MRARNRNHSRDGFDKQPKDWHRADIIAALRKRGWTLRQLSTRHGYAADTLRKALVKSYPKAQELIGDAIGVPARIIWPSRYAKKPQGKKS